MAQAFTGPPIWQALELARGPVQALFALPPQARAAWLRERLANPPPALVLASGDGLRLPGRENRSTPAAVLVPVLQRGNELEVILTQRSQAMGDHGGQVSFPGGRCDHEHETAEQTALREAEEEIGLPAARVNTLGRLAHYDTITGYRVTPVIGWIEDEIELVTDPHEVAAIFRVPLAFLLDPSNYRRHRYELGDKPRHYFSVPYQGHYIWGATATMLLMFYHTLLGGPD
ncbi:hypothetical protein BURK2_00157 [Burkholderiales bacterium]|nr:MAG: CoA pyrophosphatase [Burkholderiales bacterium]CAG0950326.1 hypothetical protein BURK2_00157 [Burkholderiales bacterium]